jgi:very-short-patch-repair endonuclease
MKQPIKKRTSVTKNNNKTKKRTAPKVKTTKKAVRNHPKFGTSKLEQDFARDFLDKLGVKYQYQLEAVSIGRFYDYYLPEHNLIIEIQGSYWHGDSRLYEEKDLNKIQKKNIRVDEYKQKWALTHGIPIYYVWEKDIRENPKMVMEELKKRLYIQDEKIKVKKNNSKRHINKIK